MLLHCNSCGTDFAVGLAACPHCWEQDYVEKEGDMAKTTKLGGASHEGDPVEDDNVKVEAEAVAEEKTDEGAEPAKPAVKRAPAKRI